MAVVILLVQVELVVVFQERFMEVMVNVQVVLDISLEVEEVDHTPQLLQALEV